VYLVCAEVDRWVRGGYRSEQGRVWWHTPVILYGDRRMVIQEQPEKKLDPTSKTGWA
jgi:hypothetical protein